jgi:opacity protein-like surface antigen
MKKFLFALIVLIIGSSAAQAQGFRLNGYALYTFDDQVSSFQSNTQYFEGKIKGGLTWGVGAEFLVRPELGVELSYYRMDTKAPTTFFDNGVKNATLDVALNWIMLGGVGYLKLNNPKVEPYGGFMLGAGIIDVKNPNNGRTQGSTEFAWGLKGGINIWATDKVGIKLQSNLMSMVQAVGGGLFFGTGGASVGVSTFSSLLQFSLGGGLVIKLGGDEASPAKTVR